MTAFLNDILAFFFANVPDVKTLALGGPPALAWAFACLAFAGHLKARRGLRTGYTRKTFHFLIFGTVVVVHALWGTGAVCLFGAMTSVAIAYALVRGSGHFMYEAMAREKDAPRRTYYIVVPYLATLVGGVLSNVLFPATAVFGYLVTGLGDAIAEPVGTRFGRHQYRVPAIRGVRAVRSLEGSASVFAVSAIALLVCVAVSHSTSPIASALPVVLLIAAVSTLVEAISPHGWDNATMQLVPAWLGAVLLQMG